jgi:hypothetical protein
MRMETRHQQKRFHQRHRPAVLLVLACILGITLACSGGTPVDPPGVGEKAERGYQACAPIIEALDRYREANNAYPDSLADLVPDYLPAIPAEVNDEPILYERTDESYTLSFSYTGPGLNYCIYTPEVGWRCSGLY